MNSQTHMIISAIFQMEGHDHPPSTACAVALLILMPRCAISKLYTSPMCAIRSTPIFTPPVIIDWESYRRLVDG